MTKLAHKTSALLLLGFFSLQAFAASPWAEQEAAPEPEVVQDGPVIQEDNGRPATEDTNPEPQAAAREEHTEVAVQQPTTHSEVVTHGDVIDIQPHSTDPVAPVHVLDFPRRGMTTDKVKNELGEPSEIISGIGQPPISRWIYNDRTVYFEYSSVIHVVAR